MANQFPYGNAFIVGTPALDKLSDRIYQEEKQREMLRYQENKALDEEFSKNLSGIRDSDIPDLTKSYGDYKMAYKQLMRKKQGGTPEEQLDVLRKKASIYDTINKSKQQKAWEDLQLKQITGDKKGVYADDAQRTLMGLRNTPVSKYDETQNEKLLYPYSVPDLAKETERAVGKPTREVKIKTGQNGIEDTYDTYKVGNNPNQIYNSYFNDLATSNKQRNFTRFMNAAMTDDEEQDLRNRFQQKVSDPKFQQVYGDIKPLNESTEFGKAVALKTMQDVVNLPLEGKPVREVSQDRSLKAKQQFAMEQQARAAKNSLNRLFVYANIQDRKPETIGRNIDDLIGQQIEDARNNNGEVVTDNATYESITGKKKTGSSVLKFDENNNKYIYGTKDQTTGEIKTTGEVPIDLARVKLTKTYKSGLDSKYNTGKKIETPKEKFPLPKGKPRTVSQNGHTYTWNSQTGTYD